MLIAERAGARGRLVRSAPAVAVEVGEDRPPGQQPLVQFLGTVNVAVFENPAGDFAGVGVAEVEVALDLPRAVVDGVPAASAARRGLDVADLLDLTHDVAARRNTLEEVASRRPGDRGRLAAADVQRPGIQSPGIEKV